MYAQQVPMQQTVYSQPQIQGQTPAQPTPAQMLPPVESNRVVVDIRDPNESKPVTVSM